MLVLIFPKPAEDHLTRGRLQNTGNRDVRGLADQPACVIDNNHRTVVEICDALVVFLSFLQNEYTHGLTRQHDRFERVCELVDIKDLNTAKLRDLIKVKVVGNYHRVKLLAQFDQLQIDFLHGGKIGLDDLNIELAVVSETLKHIQPATTALAL